MLAYGSGFLAGTAEDFGDSASSSVMGMDEGEEADGKRGKGNAFWSASVSVSVSSGFGGDETAVGRPVRLKRRTDSSPESLSLKWTFFAPKNGVEGSDWALEWRARTASSAMEEEDEDLREGLSGRPLERMMVEDELVLEIGLGLGGWEGEYMPGDASGEEVGKGIACACGVSGPSGEGGGELS